MFHNNYITKETQNQVANSFLASVHIKLKPFQEKIIKTRESKAPENPFDKLGYLVKVKLQGLHEFKNKSQELKEDRTYIKLMLANLVQSEINKLVINYNSVASEWNKDKVKRANFIRDYNGIINKALNTYDVINKDLPLKSTTFGFLKPIPASAEPSDILSYINQLTKDIKDYNEVRKSMRTVVELDLTEIQLVEKIKKEYVSALPSVPVTLEEIKEFINSEFKSIKDSEKGDFARDYLANALAHEFNKLSRDFNARESKPDKAALKKYFEDTEKLLNNANAILSIINKKFQQDPYRFLDSAINQLLENCCLEQQKLLKFADFKVVIFKKPNGWLDKLLENSRFAEHIKYAEKSEVEAKTRTAGRVAEGIGMAVLFLPVAVCIGAGSNPYGTYQASINTQLMSDAGQAVFAKKQRESWEPPLSRVAREKTTGDAFAVREDIEAKEIIGEVTLDVTGRPQIVYFSKKPSQDEEKTFEFLYCIEAQSIVSLRSKGTNHQIGPGNPKGQIMVCRTLADAFGVCDVRCNGETYDQRLGWRKYQSWSDQQRQSDSGLDPEIDKKVECKLF